MTKEEFNVLVVDDEVLYAQAVVRELVRHGIGCGVAHSAAEAVRQADAGAFDLILLDNRLPDEEGLSILPRLLARQPRPAVVVMTAYQTIPQAVKAMRRGAEDYLVKETSLGSLVERVSASWPLPSAATATTLNTPVASDVASKRVPSWLNHAPRMLIVSKKSAAE